MRDLSSRSADASDAHGILAVGLARDVADLGAPDWTLYDVRDELAEADHAWVVEDAQGEVVAAALLRSGDVRVLVHPDACGRGIGTHLRETVEAAAAPGTLLRQVVSGSNVRDAFDQRGANSVGRAQFAPDLSTLAFEVDGSLAGVALCERWIEEGDGFMAYLATARAWRGRGLGRALLVDALARMRAAGLVRAAVSVNGNNPSATALYESVGMRVESHADRYDKLLP